MGNFQRCLTQEATWNSHPFYSFKAHSSEHVLWYWMTRSLAWILHSRTIKFQYASQISLYTSSKFAIDNEVYLHNSETTYWSSTGNRLLWSLQGFWMDNMSLKSCGVHREIVNPRSRSLPWLTFCMKIGGRGNEPNICYMLYMSICGVRRFYNGRIWGTEQNQPIKTKREYQCTAYTIYIISWKIVLNKQGLLRNRKCQQVRKKYRPRIPISRGR